MKSLFRFLTKLLDLMTRLKPKPTGPEVILPEKPRLDLDIPLMGSRHWRGLVWHHSFSPDNKERDWPGIVRYHTSYRIDFNIVSKDEFEQRKAAGQGRVFQKPWRDVGYHGGTELVDGEPVFIWGRPLSMIGAHSGVAGVSNRFNQEFLGLCSIGNFDPLSPAPALWEFNLKLTRSLMDAFGFSAGNVIGHREVFEKLGVPIQKSCPGKVWNMELFRRSL